MKEPDTTPVTKEHIKSFLDWCASKRGRDPNDMDEHWFSALSTLNLGQLRSGMKLLQKEFEPSFKLTPVEFWNVCTNGRSQKTIVAFREMRQHLKNGINVTRPNKKRGMEHNKPGNRED